MTGCPQVDASVSVNVWTDSLQTDAAERLQALSLSTLRSGKSTYHPGALALLTVLNSCMGGGVSFLDQLVAVRFGRMMHAGVTLRPEDPTLPWAKHRFCRGQKRQDYEVLATQKAQAARKFADAACAEIGSLPAGSAELWTGNWAETLALTLVGDARYVAAFLHEAAACGEAV